MACTTKEHRIKRTLPTLAIVILGKFTVTTIILQSINKNCVPAYRGRNQLEKDHMSTQGRKIREKDNFRVIPHPSSFPVNVSDNGPCLSFYLEKGWIRRKIKGRISTSRSIERTQKPQNESPWEVTGGYVVKSLIRIQFHNGWDISPNASYFSSFYISDWGVYFEWRLMDKLEIETEVHCLFVHWKRSMSTCIQNLPRELLSTILEYLTLSEAMALSLASKRMEGQNH